MHHSLSKHLLLYDFAAATDTTSGCQGDLATFFTSLSTQSLNVTLECLGV
jgi:hypothetical protein